MTPKNYKLGHTYYLVSPVGGGGPKFFGPLAGSEDVQLALLAAYLRELRPDEEPGRYDGASTTGAVVIACKGGGTPGMRLVRGESVCEHSAQSWSRDSSTGETRCDDCQALIQEPDFRPASGGVDR